MAAAMLSWSFMRGHWGIGYGFRIRVFVNAGLLGFEVYELHFFLFFRQD